jgi:hypothetical protein
LPPPATGRRTARTASVFLRTGILEQRLPSSGHTFSFTRRLFRLWLETIFSSPALKHGGIGRAQRVPQVN